MNAIDEILYIFYGWDRLGGHFTRDGRDSKERWDIYEMYGILNTYNTYFSII
jgi:hypothetical protein